MSRHQEPGGELAGLQSPGLAQPYYLEAGGAGAARPLRPDFLDVSKAEPILPPKPPQAAVSRLPEENQRQHLLVTP